jgi:hypothetical protein
VPFSLVTFFWASKRKSPAAGLPPAIFVLVFHTETNGGIRFTPPALQTANPGNPQKQ